MITEKEETELFEILEPHTIDIQNKEVIDMVEKIKDWRNKQNSLNQVKEFMLTTNQPVERNPRINPDRIKLRLSLILEELTELAQALGSESIFGDLLRDKLDNLKLTENKDLKEVLDALVDLRYVTDGAVHEFGFGNVHDLAFNEVHKSNMSKFSNTPEEATATFEKYQGQGIECYNKQIGNLWITYRTGDNKVLKSINYKEPELKQFINS